MSSAGRQGAALQPTASSQSAVNFQPAASRPLSTRWSSLLPRDWQPAGLTDDSLYSALAYVSQWSGEDERRVAVRRLIAASLLPTSDQPPPLAASPAGEQVPLLPSGRQGAVLQPAASSQPPPLATSPAGGKSHLSSVGRQGAASQPAVSRCPLPTSLIPPQRPWVWPCPPHARH